MFRLQVSFSSTETELLFFFSFFASTFSDNLSLFNSVPLCNCCALAASSHEGTLQMKTADTERWDELTEMRSHALSVRIIVWVQSCVTVFIRRENCVNTKATGRHSIPWVQASRTGFIWVVMVGEGFFFCTSERSCLRLYLVLAHSIPLSHVWLDIWYDCIATSAICTIVITEIHYKCFCMVPENVISTWLSVNHLGRGTGIRINSPDF